MNKSIIQETITNLEKNNFQVYLFDNHEKAVSQIMKQLSEAKSISRSGSVTLNTIGLIDKIQEKGLPFRDYVSPEDRKASIQAEYYLASTNAITTEGHLINYDGCGNRVAALAYGPDKIFVIAGTNKIVKDFVEAIHRIKTIAAPKNATRLNKSTPCTKSGTCSDCSSEDRICRTLSVITKPLSNRITVFLIDEELGY